MADIINVHQTCGSRMRKSIKSLAIVPFILIGAIWLLVWNEGNSIRQHKALDEGLKVVVELDENTTQINVDLDGKLVHFVGTATAADLVYDNIFGVGQQNGSENFLKISRNVQMYQWVESKSTDDGNTRYSYKKQWEEYAVDSNNFESLSDHENPGVMLYDKKIFETKVLAGNFTFSSALTRKMNWWEPYPGNLNTEDILDAFARTEATLTGDSYYYGKGTKINPKIGDTMVDFEVVKSQVISVVAMQYKGELSTYTGKSGGTVLLIEPGYREVGGMFQRASDSVTFQAWLFRFLGLLLIFVACLVVMKPLTLVTESIPIVGDLVEAGSCCFASIVSIIITVIVVSIAWFAYRPVLSAILLAVLGLLTGLVLWQLRGKKQTRQHQQADRNLNLEEGGEDNDEKDEDEDNIPIAEAIVLTEGDEKPSEKV